MRRPANIGVRGYEGVGRSSGSAGGSMTARSFGRIGMAATLAAGVIGFAVFASISAASASPTPVCSGGTCTVTFTTVGVGQSWVVPADVTSASFVLVGAAGGGDSSVAGGDGAEVTGSLSLTAGTTVTVDVGGGVADDVATGGINGGGAGGGGSGGGGAGGGGGTDIELAGVLQLVAGGGGGAGGRGWTMPQFFVLLLGWHRGERGRDGRRRGPACCRRGHARRRRRGPCRKPGR